MSYIPIDGEKILTEQENEILNKFYEENVVNENILSVLEKIYKREINRIYPKNKRASFLQGWKISIKIAR